ncbi:M20/M25/M40 family metallo-hydrolase [Cellulomonas fengjieae]|uniref:M20/M25/M40 family metallo-hydrolase n=1 Tax=Cellulomonas fengjieae TaxID=2819978 RepID=A0ABS3SJS7_9CELL|nr:M20/M25/M40 family metallo-hydrolase [Cellulomonas fengjieae]MBO3086002.1 M20/M25/M40 family metallo-hydrolase [Cellulomonas fengjieae]MBO3103951.1 M20/M25/M40 family metallo-hydrolase [Cellulomonas fengjieae]QVI65928.1 M20/M25/M40 family metallo-hydrolase [Cellulomonas fengjieae]
MAPRRTLVALVSSISILAAGALASPAAAHGRGGTPERFAQQVSTRAVLGHLAALQQIADRNGGNRAALTPGYEASARYVEKTLRKAGYRTERDPFTFDREVIDTATLTAGATAYEVDQMAFSPNAPAGGVTADLAAPTDPLGCAPDDWAGVEVTGRIALVSRGVCPFGDKAVNAEAAGAVGVVIYNNVPDVQLFGTLGAEGLVEVPVAGIRQADGQALATALAAGPVTVTLDLSSHVETVESFNVIAETRQGRDDNVVMLGAHLDGVEEGPGINDNGTGSAAILEVAVQLAKSHTRHHNTVRFAWWGAEELGLQGSTAYVAELATQEGELDRIATYLNYDMVGSPNYIIGVYDADQSTYPAPVEVPAGSEATEDVLTTWFDSVGQPWVDTEFSGRSDYQAFILNGIPASGLFTGADDIKTDEEVALFGGTAGITHDPNYHSAGDDLSNVNRTALAIMTKAIAASTYSLAWDTSAINGVSGPGDDRPRPWPGHGHGRHGDQDDRTLWERAS